MRTLRTISCACFLLAVCGRTLPTVAAFGIVGLFCAWRGGLFAGV